MKNTSHSFFQAALTKKILLTPPPSTKKTYHIRLVFQGSRPEYKPGDALGIYPKNDPKEVHRILDRLHVSPNTNLWNRYTKSYCSAFDLLSQSVNLTRVTKPMMALLEQKTGVMPPLSCQDQSIEEFVTQFAKHLDLLEISELFAPMLPRFYSIASSPQADPFAIDLLVATFSYQKNGKEVFGLCPHYLCHQTELNAFTIKTFILKAAHFILPENPQTPMIMIGPGTGVAPFRAFMQHKELNKQPLNNDWLFFGERNRATDYYYKEYWHQLAKEQGLNLAVAFSRDQEKKYYVSDCILEYRHQIYSLIQQGAHIYICGDAKHMAKSVTKSLEEISLYGNSKGCPKQWIQTLRSNKQLLLDVY